MDDVAREAALLALKKETSNLPTKRELAWQEIQNGVRPEYVALKYGLPVLKMVAAAEEHRRRLESKANARIAERQERSDPT